MSDSGETNIGNQLSSGDRERIRGGWGVSPGPHSHQLSSGNFNCFITGSIGRLSSIVPQQQKIHTLRMNQEEKPVAWVNDFAEMKVQMCTPLCEDPAVNRESLEGMSGELVVGRRPGRQGCSVDNSRNKLCHICHLLQMVRGVMRAAAHSPTFALLCAVCIRRSHQSPAPASLTLQRWSLSRDGPLITDVCLRLFADGHGLRGSLYPTHISSLVKICCVWLVNSVPVIVPDLAERQHASPSCHSFQNSLLP